MALGHCITLHHQRKFSLKSICYSNHGLVEQRLSTIAGGLNALPFPLSLLNQSIQNSKNRP